MQKIKSYRLILFLILALALFFSRCETGPFLDDPIKIADQAFLDALLDGAKNKYGMPLIVDKNGDGLISYGEAESLTFLDTSDQGISNLSGISKFINLKYLYCQENQITKLDLSRNLALEVLGCWNNKMYTLDVSRNAELRNLDCSNNVLFSLDLATNLLLDTLNFRNNLLSAIDISNNDSLLLMDGAENQLASLDPGNNRRLIDLFCANNQLSSLDVVGLFSLRNLFCGGNQLSTLNASTNSNLWNLWVNDMPSLTEICVWVMPFPPENIMISSTGSPNAYFTDLCSL